MNNLQTFFEEYIAFCQYQKRLDRKTLNAYKTDLKQFSQQLHSISIEAVTPDMLENYISHLHQSYKPKTVKRKIASLKAFFHYLEYKEIIDRNPFNKIHVKFREPVILPKTIPLHLMELLFTTMYQQHVIATTPYQKRKTLRDIAVVETLFSTGIRISELCSLKETDVNLHDGSILILGKGSKERLIQIGNTDVLQLLMKYKNVFYQEIGKANHFFVNPNSSPLSDQSVRRMLKKYAAIAGIDLHITPHMFRHTFATSLLEADVDIRYIQEMLGHSSINVTEIYTHVALSKQKDILQNKHPRQKFVLKVTDNF
jgi:integrase/recombinase XerD